ncbi:PREDICTED: endogenous retrovirus group 3 member 1 Env polyprotein-like [Gekko japonicus]|uniref:Endogenous retrovirus group 3 member 1 Env polyprotein-like n=1 Tax=Gekko japonicus TaxID=146911 RepID=A0ABM1JIP5_GEKJA|nr:PREDICTED: endogenous retrovirus group 3 member 1 Env polyprotein-like [Gekko japonicus]
MYGVGIDIGGRKSPYGRIVIETISSKIQSTEMKIHTTFWSEMGKVIEIPPVTKNLFIDLAERIAGELSVKNCYVCGGTNMGEQWPWEAKEVELNNISHAFNLSWNNIHRPSRWILKNPLVGHTCFIRQGAPFNISVGALDCEEGWFCNGTQPKAYINFANPNVTQAPPYVNMSRLQVLWDNPCSTSKEWRAPDSLYWICGPATWAADGTYGYRTPIYMLNRIIRLQAVLEIITNETSLALSVLAETNTQLRTAVYQNRLALDFLLATEGGVCGKFNLSNCCLQIDDNGKAIEQITEHMRNLAHVPVQTWTGIDTEDWFGNILGDWKRILFLIALAFGGLLLLPCLIPLIKNVATKTVNAMLAHNDTVKLLYLVTAKRNRLNTNA